MSAASTRLAGLRENLRASLWPVPVTAVVLAVVAGIYLPRLDAAVEDALPGWVSALLFGGGAGAARTFLDAIASSLITVTSLTFSLTVVTLQLASSQFSPRLLRNFTRDRVVHFTLGLFLATFSYALTVLRTIRSADESAAPFVPQLSVTVAFALTVASVVALVTFLSHLTRQIRVETVLDQVHVEARTVTSGLLGDEQPSPADDELARAWASLPDQRDATPVTVEGSGFVVGIDEEGLLAAATSADAVIVVERAPGQHVVAGTPVAVAHAVDGGALDDDVVRDLGEQVRRAVVLGAERTGAQDIGFGLRQLTDVAVKALSPGINDPTTAVHALGHSSALLCELAAHHLGPRVVREEEADGETDEDRGSSPRGRVRLVLARPRLADLLELAVAQPRRYGASDPDVLARLFTLLREVAWCAGPSSRHDVLEQLARLRTTCAAQDFDEHERSVLAGLGEQVEAATTGRWLPATAPPLSPPAPDPPL